MYVRAAPIHELAIQPDLAITIVVSPFHLVSPNRRLPRLRLLRPIRPHRTYNCAKCATR
ncbi:hypothetical protein Salmuc_01915 [Salipiger mucosus DSM 16094]|uniref:Uncharacterized protein n=1 Tax=Salipiger mucosus DSM 16094 TaxID=1123237 RepID=S9R1I8_9RHOB|nr:hypothetical protein Salmuc_01915 [Salipiger mucosus DSM 16094]